jgi:predicted ABC-type ATPase
LTVIAGPNGSGKSTLTSSIWFEGSASLIDADAIARRLDAAEPLRAPIPAAGEAISRCRALLADRASSALETTLSGHGEMRIVAVIPANRFWTGGNRSQDAVNKTVHEQR